MLACRLRLGASMKLLAVLRKAFLRQRLERDAALTATKLARAAPGADCRDMVRHLKRVHLALLRIRHRDYGVCASCGAPIRDARLRLMPTAGACATCQTKLDRQTRG